MAADGKLVLVADYYQEALGKTVQYTKLPLVRVGKKVRRESCKDEEEYYRKMKKVQLFPLEFCIMKANQKVKKLSDTQIADLIKDAAKPCKFVSAK